MCGGARLKNKNMFILYKMFNYNSTIENHEDLSNRERTQDQSRYPPQNGNADFNTDNSYLPQFDTRVNTTPYNVFRNYIDVVSYKPNENFLFVKYPGANKFVKIENPRNQLTQEIDTAKYKEVFGWGGGGVAPAERVAPIEESLIASLIASLAPTEKEGKSHPRNILSVVLIYFINSIARKRVISTGSRASARDTSY